MIELLVSATGFASQQHGKSFPFNASRSGHHDRLIPLYSFGDSVQVLRDFHPGAARELARAFQVRELCGAHTGRAQLQALPEAGTTRMCPLHADVGKPSCRESCPSQRCF